MADTSLLPLAPFNLRRRITAAPTRRRVPPSAMPTIATVCTPSSLLLLLLLEDRSVVGTEMVSSFGSPSRGVAGGTSDSFSTGAAILQ